MKKITFSSFITSVTITLITAVGPLILMPISTVFGRSFYLPDWLEERYFANIILILVIAVYILIYFKIRKSLKTMVRPFLIGVLLFFILFIAGSLTNRWLYNDPDYKILQKIEIGMSEDQVYDILGKPAMKYEKDTAPEDYYVKGYYYRKRKITNKVLIYYKSLDRIVYVYIDKDKKVEFVGIYGS